MNRIRWSLLLVVGLCLSINACTTRAWYDGLQEQQRQECYKCRDREATQECLDNLNRRTYDTYQKERGEIGK